MSKVCPITYRRVDASRTRIVAWGIVVLLIAILLTEHYWVATILFLDFTLRLLRLYWVSPLYLFACLLQKIMGMRRCQSDEGPKRFALYLGWAVSSGIVLLYLFGFSAYGNLLVLLLLACALSEAVFDLCVGCRFYEWLTRKEVV
jgi:hypothetical protein